MAIGKTARMIKWICQFLIELQNQQQSIVVYQDSRETIDWAELERAYNQGVNI